MVLFKLGCEVGSGRRCLRVLTQGDFSVFSGAQVLTGGGGGGTGLCFMEEQTVMGESKLCNCVYPRFLAMSLK